DGETNQYQDGAPHLENLRPNEERSIRRAPRTEGKARRIRARRIDLCWTEPLLRRRPVGDSIRSVGGSWPGGCQPSLPRARAIAPPRCLPPTAQRFSSTSDDVARRLRTRQRASGVSLTRWQVRLIPPAAAVNQKCRRLA